MTDNRRHIRSIDISLGDALMLMEGMRIAANTAMMCGHPAAEARLRAYQKMFDDLAPPAARQFGGSTFAEISEALALATSYSITVRVANRSSWLHDSTGPIFVRIGDREWRSKSSSHLEKSEAFEAVVALLAELAPVDCLRMEKPEHA